MTFPAFTQGEKRTLFFYDQSKLIEVLRENKQQTRGSLSLCIHRFANKCLPPLDSKHSQRSTVEKPKTQRPPELTSVELFMAELSKGMQTLRFVQLEMNVTNWSSSEYDALGRLVAQSTYKKQAPLCYLRLNEVDSTTLSYCGSWLKQKSIIRGLKLRKGRILDDTAVQVFCEGVVASQKLKRLEFWKVFDVSSSALLYSTVLEENNLSALEIRNCDFGMVNVDSVQAAQDQPGALKTLVVSDVLEQGYFDYTNQDLLERDAWIYQVKIAIESGMTTKFQRNKLMFIGNGGAGKTATKRGLLGYPFSKEYESTVVGEASKQVELVNVTEWKERIGSEEDNLLKDDFHHILKKLKRGKRLRGKKKPLPEMDTNMSSRLTSNRSNASDGNVITSRKARTASVATGVESIENTILPSSSRSTIKVNFKAVVKGVRYMPLTKQRPRSPSAILTRPNAKQALQIFRLRSRKKKGPESMEEITVDAPTFAVWDFAGQEIFYTVHHIFLTDHGIYLLVFNMEAMLKDPTAEFKTLKFWLDSVYLHATRAPVILVGTHCDSVTNVEQLEMNRGLEDLLYGYSSLQIVVNEEAQLSFFPIDNSLGVKNKMFLDKVKRKIEKLVDTSAGGLMKHLRTDVPLAWLFFMDHLIKREKTHIKYDVVVAEGRAIGFSLNEVRAILNFYHEAGTIVHFANKKQMDSELSTTTSLHDVVILVPHWLLVALACILYDVKIHRSKQYVYPDYRQEIIEYERTAILPKYLLDQLWKDYDSTTRSFLLSLNLRMLLMSRYMFMMQTDYADPISGDEEGSRCIAVPTSNDTDYFVVPGMLTKRVPYESRLPDEDSRITVFLQFHKPSPKGLFERVLCLFLTESAQIEGSSRPNLFVDYAEIKFQNADIFVINEQEDRRIKLVIDSFHASWLEEIFLFCEECLIIIKEDVFGKSYTGDVLLQSPTNPKIICRLEDIREAVRTNVAKIRTYPGPKLAKMDHFRVLLSAVDAGDDESCTRVREVLQTDVQFDCFLAHEWGTEADGFETHKRVSVIKQMLVQAGFQVWLDEEQLKGSIAKGISNGLRSSDKVCIFLTKRYMQRLENPNNNCTKEFNLAVTRKGVEYIIVVLLDPTLRDPVSWSDDLAFNFGSRLYIDFTSETNIEANFQKLCDELKAPVK